ncbi:MAG: o-succinylbenzoate synthase [Actinomycetaceae bacterium]|nr:o-succinylbenzoate synthase [Actinomycetaceae bacterium]
MNDIASPPKNTRLIEIGIEALPAEVLNALDGITRLLYYRLPLKNRFRRIDVRDGLILKGPNGWAEVSPFWDYDAPESSQWLRAGLEAARGKPLELKRDAVPINATVPVVDPLTAQKIVENSGGCTTVKVKVADPGSTISQDCERIEAVRDVLGPEGKIRVDANAAWDVDEALAAIRELNAAAASGGGDGLEYVEQPCPTVDELAAVRRQVDVRIAADESVRRASDPLEVARAEAADLVIVKVQPLGGAARLIEVCQNAGMPAVVSSALDSSVGLARGVECAAALDDLEFACGLGTARMFTDDVTAEPMIPQGGELRPRDIEIDESRITYLPTDERDLRELRRWIVRLEEMVHCLR